MSLPSDEQMPYSRPILLSLGVVSLLVFALLGVWLWRQRQPAVEWVLINQHPAYQIIFSPLRGTESVTQHFEAVLAERGIKRIEVLMTDALQPQHPYAWMQGDDVHIFYKSYSLEQQGRTLQIWLSLDADALRQFDFTLGQIASELEAMLYSALVSLSGEWSEQELHDNGNDLYTLFSSRSTTRLFVIQMTPDEN